MSEKEEPEFSRIKELESTNLATADKRDMVVKTKKEVEKDNLLLAEKINQSFHFQKLVSLLSQVMTQLHHYF